MTPTGYPELSLAHRPDLFEAIRAHGPDPTAPLSRCTFGDRPGWLVRDLAWARLVLTSSVGRKSRPEHSQRLLGGVGAMRGERVRNVKRQLIAAMGAAASRQDEIRDHLRATLPGGGFPAPREQVTEAVASAMLAQVTGQPAGSVDGARLRTLVRRSWTALERPSAAVGDHVAELRDDLLAFVTGLVAGSDSAFLSRLAADGWSTAQIAEELRAMVLAGWGSTTAATLSAISLGVPPEAPAPAVDEVLRLYPPSFMIARAVVEERAVVPFAVGDLVLVSPWLIHRHPRGWPSPDTYDPGRWAATARPHWFLPFGVGPRRCPAARFARAQVSAALRLHGRAPRPGPGTLALVELRSPSLVPDWA